MTYGILFLFFCALIIPDLFGVQKLSGSSVYTSVLTAYGKSTKSNNINLKNGNIELAKNKSKETQNLCVFFWLSIFLFRCGNMGQSAQQHFLDFAYNGGLYAFNRSLPILSKHIPLLVKRFSFWTKFFIHGVVKSILNVCIYIIALEGRQFMFIQ